MMLPAAYLTQNGLPGQLIVDTGIYLGLHLQTQIGLATQES